MAARIIYLLFKNPSEGKKKKKIFDQGVGLLETCLESVPSAYIITIIMLTANGENMNTIFGINLILFVTVLDGDKSLGNIISNPNSHSLKIFGVSPSRDVAANEFLTTYAISIISATLGVSKILKNGVARPIAPGGPLEGLLSGKFLLGFLASAGGLVFRGLCIGFAVVSHYQ